MTDMYGNAIIAANGNLAYAQMLDNQANFEITENDAEKEKLTNRFQGFQAIDANGDHIPNQTIFEAVDEDIQLGIKVYFSMQTKVDSTFKLILKDFETGENPVEFSCPTTTEEVKEITCYTTIAARNSIDITGYNKLISGNTNQYDQLLNKVTNITYNVDHFAITFAENVTQSNNFTVLIGKKVNNVVDGEVLATCVGIVNATSTTCTTTSTIDDATAYNNIRSGTDTNPWVLDRLDSLKVVAKVGENYNETNKTVYTNGETLYLEVVFNGRLNITKEFSAVFGNGTEGLGVVCEAASGIGSADGKTRTICSTLIHESNVIDVSDYIGTIVADTINPWVSGFRLMEKQADDTFKPTTRTQYGRGATIYIQAIFSEKVKFAGVINLVIKGSVSEELLFSCTVPTDYVDNLICSYTVSDSLDEEIEINQLKVIAIITQDDFIVEDTDTSTLDTKAHIIKIGEGYQIFKAGVRLTTITSAVDMAGNPLDADIKSSGNIDYGDLGADDPAIDLKVPEIIEVVGPIKANAGPFVGEDGNELFYKKNGAAKYIVTVDDKNNMYFNWCKVKFHVEARLNEVDNKILNYNVSGSDCELKLDALNASGYSREFEIEIDGVKYARVNGHVLLETVTVGVGADADIRRKLTLTLTITALEENCEIYFEIEEGAFKDLADNVNLNSNDAYYSGTSVALAPNVRVHIDNEAPEALYIEIANTQWFDISGNSYNYSYEDAAGVLHNNIGCNFAWQADGSMKGCVEYNPIEPDLQNYGEVKPIVNTNEVTGRDEFINDNYFGRTLFKKDFTIELLVKVTQPGARQLFKITSLEAGADNGEWVFSFNFRADHVGKFAYFAVTYNSKDAYVSGNYLSQGMYTIYSNLTTDSYNEDISVYKAATTLDIRGGTASTVGIVGAMTVSDTSIETITFGDSETYLYSVRTYSGPAKTRTTKTSPP